MKTYQITGEQISKIHNGMCSLRRVIDLCDDLFKENSSFVKGLKEAISYIEPVRKVLVDMKDDDMNRIREIAEEISARHNFEYTRWSIYDIESFSDKSVVPTGALLCAPYDSKESVVVKGDTWLDLWKAVEELGSKTITGESYRGFGYHVFIERFTKVKNEENAYEVWLGS